MPAWLGAFFRRPLDEIKDSTSIFNRQKLGNAVKDRRPAGPSSITPPHRHWRAKTNCALTACTLAQIEFGEFFEIQHGEFPERLGTCDQDAAIRDRVTKVAPDPRINDNCGSMSPGMRAWRA